MQIISVNCSSGQTVIWRGSPVQTGIFKTPVSGPVKVNKLNLEGDRQSDLKVHGGPDKAVYSYDLQDYRWWSEELQRELDPGAFGENLTTDGLSDRNVYVGDVLQFGSAILQAVQPRLPCYKLGIKFNDDLMPKRFMKAARWGIYFRVLQEGLVAAGDSIRFLSRDPQQVTIADLARLAAGPRNDIDLMRRVLAISSLARNWREMLAEIIEDPSVSK